MRFWSSPSAVILPSPSGLRPSTNAAKQKNPQKKRPESSKRSAPLRFLNPGTSFRSDEEKAIKSPKNTATDAHGLGAPTLCFRTPGAA
ncbi:hypothetical protein NDU88_002590 [Pleurodeles waltl]|uniref:Uncharacterized protein n=1 Tax=Pleurodeles waltl TaxID=8319 RepID=A0AAV7PC35_PLEWA|nr:hypothetical protein NDU88_002590 [Pleurodeles waltl]